MPRTVSNTEIATRPITSTSSVLMLRCTSTLSITTWKNSGETSAKSCRKNDATSTSPSSVAVFVDGAEEPGDVEPPRQIERARRAASSARAGRPTPPRIRRASSGAVAAPMRRLNNALSVADLAEQQKAAVAQRGDRRQRRDGKPLPARSAGARPETEFLGAAQHLLDTELAHAKAMMQLRASAPIPWKRSSATKTDSAGSRVWL